MNLNSPNLEFFVPDNKPVEEALLRSTHIGIGAHPDDLEIMAYHGILECYESEINRFLGIIVTNGSGSPRDGKYAKYTDLEMQGIRAQEQKKAAVIGKYSGVALLNYTSGEVKNSTTADKVKSDIKELLLSTHAEVVYTHNLADKHETHVAVAIRTIDAVRELPVTHKPGKVYGCEVWRDLDWLPDEDKVAFNVSSTNEEQENLATALLTVYDSQIAGGKRYDIATLGRRRANATYYASHGVDLSTGLIFAMDLTPLIVNPDLDIVGFVNQYFGKFTQDVTTLIKKISSFR